MQLLHAQSWNITGNSGLATSNFLGSTDNHDVIFKANNAERGRLAATGFWRFGNAPNFAKVDSTGTLTFGGTGAYKVAGNKYAFQYTGNPNYGLFFNSTSVQYEFRNGSAVPVFSVNANTGNSVFNGTVKIGAYTLPSTDGINGQVLTTNGTGTVSWSNVSGSSGANSSLSNLAATTAINAGLLPGTDNSISLGSSGKGWANIYIDDALYMGGTQFLTGNAGLGTTAVGSGALLNNFGSYNTANGFQALYSNFTGYNNTANGYGSLSSNTTGYSNVAIGSNALAKNTIGWAQVAIGDQALANSVIDPTNTYSCVAVGYAALNANTSGYGNTGIGTYAGYSNSTSVNNTAIGDYALFSNTATDNTATGSLAMEYNTTGASNTAQGYAALYANTTGANNTAVGSTAMQTNTTGGNNTAQGYAALYSNTTGANNTAQGYTALYANTTGINNTANGYAALYSNTTGNDNVANGLEALYFNTTGGDNTANGYEALYSNTTGGDNTANGINALFSNTTGNGNTANGTGALSSNTTGYANTANGNGALSFNTTGYENTANGYGALASNTTGSYNIALGAYADVAYSNLSNATVIGEQAYIGVSNAVIIGNPSVTFIGGVVGWTSFSDGRYKKNIKEDVQGLKFINLLKPITYTVDINGLNTHYDNLRKHDSAYDKAKAQMQPSADAASRIIYNGFIAQDVEKAAQSINYNFSGVDKPQNKDGLYGLRYSDFVVPLVKAVQELSSQNDSLKQQNADLQKQMNDLKTLVLQIQQQQQSCGCSASVNSGAVQQYNVALSNIASLEQNIPNPFANSTTIGYTLPQKFSSAQIIIADKNGKVLKQFTLSGAGKGSVHVDAAMLSSGAYSYALYVDGKMIDSKQMVLAK
jgi:hypothetical protein